MDDQGNRCWTLGNPCSMRHHGLGLSETLEMASGMGGLCSVMFQEDFACQIDHRSYERQGLDILHQARRPHIRAMEVRASHQQGELTAGYGPPTPCSRKRRRSWQPCWICSKRSRKPFQPTGSPHCLSCFAGIWKTAMQVPGATRQR